MEGDCERLCRRTCLLWSKYLDARRHRLEYLVCTFLPYSH